MFMQIKKILCYDKIDVSEGIDVNKTRASQKGDACHYCYFFNFSFNVWNRCHDLSMMFVNLSKP